MSKSEISMILGKLVKFIPFTGIIAIIRRLVFSLYGPGLSVDSFFLITTVFAWLSAGYHSVLRIMSIYHLHLPTSPLCATPQWLR